MQNLFYRKWSHHFVYFVHYLFYTHQRVPYVQAVSTRNANITYRTTYSHVIGLFAQLSWKYASFSLSHIFLGWCPCRLGPCFYGRTCKQEGISASRRLPPLPFAGICETASGLWGMDAALCRSSQSSEIVNCKLLLFVHKIIHTFAC